MGGCCAIVGGLSVFVMYHCIVWNCFIVCRKNTLLSSVVIEVTEVMQLLSGLLLMFAVFELPYGQVYHVVVVILYS